MSDFMRFVGTLAAALIWLLPARFAPAAVGYSRDVLPVLANNCFACHGHDDQKRKADLRLDLRESAVKPAKGGAIAIVPGKVEKSELVRRITATNADDHMPPET